MSLDPGQRVGISLEEHSAWLTEAYEAHRAHLVAAAYRGLRDLGAAEEVVQEAFCRLWKRRDDRPASSRAWLMTVALNLVRDHFRRKRPTALPQGGLADPSRPATDLLELDGDVGAVAREVINTKLSPRDRKVMTVWLRRFLAGDDVSAKAVGEELELKPGNVRQGLFHGRKLLSEQLAARGLAP